MKPIAEQTIFISIASYCDPLLKFTITNAFSSAKFPANLRFGVIDQGPLDARLILEGETSRKQISYVHIDKRDTRGACWARALACSLYRGEDWFFQIDSHTLFEQDWDETLIQNALYCSKVNPRCILSCYPNAFEIIDGRAIAKPITEKILAQVLANDAEFEVDHAVLKFQAIPLENDEPVIGFHLGACCLFAHGNFVNEIPYDPHLYFHGEEQTIAARAYTHGWDIFHISGMPAYHLYNFGENQKLRPLHWSEDHDKDRTQRWWEIEAVSKKRVTDLLCNQKNFGIYGLGKQRSLNDYAKFCGIDYINKTLSNTARLGPWAVPD